MRRALPFLAILFLACGGNSGEPADPGTDPSQPDAAVTIDAPADAAADIPGRTWESDFEPGVETRGVVKILRLKGTPYEMGRQHAKFLKDDLKIGSDYVDTSMLGILEPWAGEWGFLDEAYAQSYQDIVDECKGMSDEAADVGWTFQRCMALAYGDVVIEWLNNGNLACSQVVAAGAATVDGELVHARNLDWDKIDFLIEHPVVIVRHPTGRIPFAVVGFPGNVAPYNGINAAGISMASNEANSANDIDRVGRSHVQMLYEALATAETLDDVQAFLLGEDSMTAENLVAADGPGKRGAVFELAATHHAVRGTGEASLVYATNHFVDPAMVPYCVPNPPEKSTMARFKRLGELLDPAAPGTLYGRLDLEKAVSILRDGHNAHTGEDIPGTQFDNGATIANNGAIYSLVFLPGKRMFWLASGGIPVPQQPFVGFSLDELLGLPGAKPADPAVIPGTLTR